ncbi:hypothetical protein RFN28_16635 [Mesorhizobium sp. VK24D]|uniref:Uncharacterized protein n=1 Tax=Mesorhizobium album TaxID=3072314 RepID=A0ABU4Y088_9HYPH|nr:hypothetical protein [Mesorhizobium sp. VK24D]MDX8480096.1 hypothetical protein [Mesorhizobium sp. VK24D]
MAELLDHDPSRRGGSSRWPWIFGKPCLRAICQRVERWEMGEPYAYAFHQTDLVSMMTRIFPYAAVGWCLLLSTTIGQADLLNEA